MYFISNEDPSAKKPDVESTPTVKSEFAETNSSADEEVNTRPNETTTKNRDSRKRVYGRARANLNFSSFYIFCEDFRQQLDILFAHESDTYRKDMLNYMWKHLNVKDKHKYYETATKARTMYDLPEYINAAENDQAKSTVESTISNNNNTEQNNSCGSKAIGKLVKVKFLKDRTTPYITLLNAKTTASAASTKAQENQ